MTRHHERACQDAPLLPDPRPMSGLLTIHNGYFAQGIMPPDHTFTAEQRYATGSIVDSEYYRSTTLDPASHVVVHGKTKYLQIQFGHRMADMKLDDVPVLPSRG